jgi:hypothetical protein
MAADRNEEPAFETIVKFLTRVGVNAEGLIGGVGAGLHQEGLGLFVVEIIGQIPVPVHRAAAHLGCFFGTGQAKGLELARFAGNEFREVHIKVGRYLYQGAHGEIALPGFPCAIFREVKPQFAGQRLSGNLLDFAEHSHPLDNLARCFSHKLSFTLKTIPQTLRQFKPSAKKTNTVNELRDPYNRREKQNESDQRRATPKSEPIPAKDKPKPTKPKPNLVKNKLKPSKAKANLPKDKLKPTKVKAKIVKDELKPA